MRRLEALPFSLAMPALAALTLTACEVPSPSLHAANRNTAIRPAVAQAMTNPATPSSKTENAAAPKPTMLAATPAAAHGVEDAAAPISPILHLTGDPKELVGLDHKVVRRALGDPRHIRNELPAQVWQYATGDCIVDLYLYNQDGALTVTYVEARSHTAEQAPTTRCLKSLLERPTASAG